MQRTTKIIHPAVRICYEHERYLRLSQDLHGFMQKRYLRALHHFTLVTQKLHSFSFVDRKLEPFFLHIEKIETKLQNSYSFIIREKAHAVRQMGGLLESYHYHNVLKRGFAVIHDKNKKLITSSKQSASVDQFYVEWHDGMIEVTKTGTSGKNVSYKKDTAPPQKQNMLF